MQPHPQITRWNADELRWAAWMVLAHRGDQYAYQQLLIELANAIETYIRARFGNIDCLEDCVQECLLAIHKARHTYDPSRPFRPWLFTIVRHKTIDLLRRDREHGDPRHVELLDAGSDPQELQRRLDGVKVLENLAPDHREAIALTQYAGCTTAEAAVQLGITEAALKARLRRGLLAIRRALEAEGLPT
jgi:RNA polymerase sigma-70 factor (ECF subfamily)